MIQVPGYFQDISKALLHPYFHMLPELQLHFHSNNNSSHHENKKKRYFFLSTYVMNVYIHTYIYIHILVFFHTNVYVYTSVYTYINRVHKKSANKHTYIHTCKACLPIVSVSAQVNEVDVNIIRGRRDTCDEIQPILLMIMRTGVDKHL